MPDDLPIPPLNAHRREPRLATEEDLEFIVARIAALPTRRQLIHSAYALGLCVLALIGVRMWLRWVWECNPV